MRRHHRLVAEELILDEELFVFNLTGDFLFKTNKTFFIRDQLCHLLDDCFPFKAGVLFSNFTI